ncbi:conserverd hypothetical protein [Pseudomonas asturiensis]|uniref:Holliday junction resolvasome, helicase subunit n=1 Tax=Pseudomonas asturiensis TaxID=1190415 RepID=A0A1M7QKD4_9PSED|nr:DUF2388 domain-containing protein [Pseudomonas asturiensis]SHN31306.1 conserverd hypothetical protein [Pseudomonas asturiensis]
MSLLRTLGAAVLLTAAATSAQASSFIVTTDTVVGAVAASTDATSDISSSFKDDKIVRAARDDAASFVASAGDIRGAQLEGAFQHIRQQLPQLHATDTQLAQAILAI